MSFSNGVESGGATLNYPAVDWLKAVAIVAVMFTHAGPGVWDSQFSAVDRLVRTVWLQFHVPTFLFVSGFLYNKERLLRISEVLSRLFRVLPPYLVVVGMAIALGIAPVSFKQSLPFRVGFGAVYGVHYYVFDLTIAVLALPLLSRLTYRMSALLFGGLVVYFCGAAVDPALRPTVSIFWLLRFPPIFFLYFLCGWLTRFRLPALEAAYAKAPALSLAIISTVFLVSLSSLYAVELSWPAHVLVRSTYSLSVIALIAAITRGARPPGLVVFLSSASYTIYLYHVVFINLLKPVVLDLSPLLRIGALLAAGLVGSVIVAEFSRRLLGQKVSRYLVGC